MARTGIEGQRFRRGPAFASGVLGPAFLVYYSPAFVRSLAMADKPLAALRLLAEVYRRARVLWPLTSFSLHLPALQHQIFITRWLKQRPRHSKVRLRP